MAPAGSAPACPQCCGWDLALLPQTRLPVLELLALALAVMAATARAPMPQGPARPFLRPSCHAGVDGLCQPRGLSGAVARCLCPPGVTWVLMAVREGDGDGVGAPVPPRRSRRVAQHHVPSCLSRPAAAALPSCCLGTRAAVSCPPVHPSSPQAPRLGAARGLVCHRGHACGAASMPGLPAAFPAPSTPRLSSGDFTTSTSVSSPLRPAGAGGEGGGPRGSTRGC